MLITLQCLDKITYDNIGGLYINKQMVSELVPIRYSKDSRQYFATIIHMSNGNSYIVPYNVNELLKYLNP